MDAILLCDNCQHDFLPKDTTQLFPALRNLNDLVRSPHPSLTDTAQIHSCIEGEERELKRCNQEITRLRDALEKLEMHRAAVSKRIEHCQGLLSPIRRIPNEILENIFAMNCIAEHGCHSLRLYDTPFPGGSPQRAAPTLTLTQVSYRWRSIGNSSARLWSTIKLEIAAPTTLAITKIMYLLECYLVRSRGHSLDLQFWQLQVTTYNNPSIFNMISPHVSRIARLDLSALSTHLRSRSPYIPHWVWDILRMGASRLTNVKMIRPPGSSWLPYHQLTAMEILQVHDCKDLIRLVPLCTQLHTLSLCIVRTSPEQVDKDIRIEAPSVCRLYIAIYDDTHLSFISRHFGFPSLVSLNISIHQMKSFAPLINAGYRRLRKFTLMVHHCLNTSTTELYQFLTSCSELTKLRLKYSSDMGSQPGSAKMLIYQLLEALCQAPSQESLRVVAPHLAELSVHEQRSSVDSGTASALLDMLEMRVTALNNNKVPIKWGLTFGILSECTKDDVEAFNAKLERLTERGLVCRIKWAKVTVSESERI